MGEIAKKVQERRLKWYGHVVRREEHYVGRRAMEMKVQGKRRRLQIRWLDTVKDDIKENKNITGKNLGIIINVNVSTGVC